MEGVEKRLDALREIIPSTCKERIESLDQVFEDAVDYILLLRTRVEILKHLVEFYGGGQEEISASNS